MKRKEKIKKLSKTDSSFQKGRVWTKLIVVCALILIAGIQVFIFINTGTFLKEAMMHLGLQSLCVLLMLSGRRMFVWMYTLAMMVSIVLSALAYQSTGSDFYLAQLVFFGVSLFLMLILMFNKSARHYRKTLRNLKKMNFDEPVSEKKEPEEAPEPIVEIPEEYEEVDPEPVMQKQYIELSGPLSLDLSYGHFSRFLVQYYPFVYLHPKFNPANRSAVQMCISAEGFDKESDELYSGVFDFQFSKDENMSIILEYEDEMGHLCALICADWLIMQKATLLKDGINISTELMKQLTEAFVYAKDAEKIPFEGFNKL